MKVLRVKKLQNVKFSLKITHIIPVFVKKEKIWLNKTPKNLAQMEGRSPKTLKIN